MADENGSANFDLGFNTDPALRDIKALRKELDGLIGDISSTSGVLTKQLEKATKPLRDLANEIKGNDFGARNARLGLQSRAYTAGERATKSYVLYGGDPADPDDVKARNRQSRTLASQAKLNEQRQEINRLTATLAKDLIQGFVDQIRTQTKVAEARIKEELFQASALVRKTSAAAINARTVLDGERIDRQIREAQPDRVAFRNRTYQRRIERDNDPELQRAMEVRRTANDTRLKYRYSADGVAEAEEKLRQAEVRKANAEIARLRREEFARSSTGQALAALKQSRQETSAEAGSDPLYLQAVRERAARRRARLKYEESEEGRAFAAQTAAQKEARAAELAVTRERTKIARDLREKFKASPEGLALEAARQRNLGNRIADAQNSDLVNAQQARRQEGQQKLIYRYSPEGQAEKRAEAEEKARKEVLRRERAEALEAERKEARARKEAADRARAELKASPEYQAGAKYRHDLGLIRNTPEARAARLANAQQSTRDDIERARVGSTAFSNQKILERTQDPSFIGVQAGIMANYAAIGGVYNSMQFLSRFVVEFDKELKQFQAISQATNAEMDGLRERFMQVGEASKFTSVEVAQAATTMAQAGLSANEVSKSITAVTKLATASGSTLQESVDLVTSVLGAFNLQGSETDKIADVVTEALNRTKLSVDKLALGFQYSANLAADAGISYTELTAILGALSNTGIRSGSTLGTGLRQLLIDLQKPTEGFKANLDRLGLSLTEVDVQSNGFLGVLKNLKDAGFTAGDAIGSFEVRAAAAYTALSNNVGTIVELNNNFATTKASTEAAATQMESLANTWTRFTTTFANSGSTAFAPMVAILQQIVGMGADTLAALRQFPGALEALGTAFAGVTALVTVSFFAKLATGAWTFVAGLNGVTTALGLLRVASLGHPLIGLATILGALAGAFYLYRNSPADFADNLEKVKNSASSIQGVLTSTEQSIKSVGDQIKTLTIQRKTLDSDPLIRKSKINEVRAQFADLGLQIDSNTSSIGDLIDKLQDLEQSLAGKMVKQYAEQLAVLRREAGLLQDQLDKKKGASRGADLANPNFRFGSDRAAAATRDGAPGATAMSLLLDRYAQMMGSRPAEPKTAEDFELLRSQAKVRELDIAEQIRSAENQPKLTTEQRRGLQQLKKDLDVAEAIVKQLTEFGDYQSQIEINQRAQEATKRKLAAEAFVNSAEGRGINEARTKLDAFRGGVQTRYAQSTNQVESLQLLKDEQDRVNREYQRALDNARVKYGAGFDQLYQDSGLQTKGATSQAELKSEFQKISESMSAFVKQRVKTIEDEISALSGSITLNSPIDKIKGVIGKIDALIAERYTTQSLAINGTPYVPTKASGEIQRDLAAAAKANGIDPAFMLALVDKESGFRRDARPIDKRTGKPMSSAYGLFQFLKNSGKSVGFQPGDDLETEIGAGVKFLNNTKSYLTKSLGRDPNNFEQYLGHLLGGPGAKKFINQTAQNPDQNAVEALGALVARNAGGKPGDTVGRLAQRQRSDFERRYAAYAKVQTEVAPDEERLADAKTLKRKSEAQALSRRLDAESKADLEGLDTLTATARAAKDPATIASLIEKAKATVPSIISRQIEAIKTDPANSERLDDADIKAKIEETETKLKRDLAQRIQKLIDLQYEAAEKKAKEPLAEAKAELEALQRSTNIDNVSSVALADAKRKVEDAEVAQVRDLARIATEKATAAEKALAEAMASTDEVAKANATDRLADARENLAVKTREQKIAEQEVAPMGYGDATLNGTRNFLQGAGTFDEKGNIKSGAQQWGAAWEEVLGNVQQGFASFSWGVAKAPKTWKEGLKAYASSFIDMLGQLIAKALSLQVIMGLFGDGKSGGLLGGLGNLFGGGGGADAAGGGGGGFFSGLGNLFGSGMANGGEVRGGVPNRDSVPRKLMPGEVVLKKRAVAAIGKKNALALNNLDGAVQSVGQPAALAQQPKAEPSLTNVWVVAPDEKPQLGPNDVIQIITNDMMTRGATRQLVKQIQTGSV